MHAQNKPLADPRRHHVGTCPKALKVNAASKFDVLELKCQHDGEAGKL